MHSPGHGQNRPKPTRSPANLSLKFDYDHGRQAAVYVPVWPGNLSALPGLPPNVRNVQGTLLQQIFKVNRSFQSKMTLRDGQSGFTTFNAEHHSAHIHERPIQKSFVSVFPAIKHQDLLFRAAYRDISHCLAIRFSFL